MTKPFVVVKWHDAEDSPVAWSTEEDLQDFATTVCEALSYGYVVKKTRGYITLAADYIAPDTYGRIMKIPRKMIISILEVQLVSPASPKIPEEPLLLLP